MCLKKAKKIEETISYIFYDHNRIKVESNNKRNFRYYTNTWRLAKMLLNEGGGALKKPKKFEKIL